MVTLEQLLDKIASSLIVNISEYSNTPSTKVKESQKFIRDNLVKIGRNLEDERMITFQSTVEANKEDTKAQFTGGDYISPFGDDVQIAQSFSNLICEINGNSWNSVLQTCEYETEDGGVDISEVRINVQGDFLTDYIAISVIGGFLINQRDITPLLVGETITGKQNPLNLGQFVALGMSTDVISTESANQFLNTN